MNIELLSGINGFFSTCVAVTAAICLLAVLIAWYTIRHRIAMSQVILGMFSYMLAMLVENVFNMVQGSAGIPESGFTTLLYLIVSVVVSRELVRLLMMKYTLVTHFDNADSALGFALGFAGFYLLVCAVYYFEIFSAVNEYLKTGTDAFFASAGTEAESAYEFLLQSTEMTGAQYIMVGLSRAFFLVRELGLCVLLWYAMKEERMRLWLVLVPLLSAAAYLPDRLYTAGMLTDQMVRDIATYVLSAGIIAIAAVAYNRREDQVAHFKVEKLRARRRR